MDNGLNEFLTENEGKVFFTVTGKAFTYVRKEKGLKISCANALSYDYTFSYVNLKKALSEMPVSRPSEFSKNIMGGSYCYAILKRYAENK